MCFWRAQLLETRGRLQFENACLSEESNQFRSTHSHEEDNTNTLDDEGALSYVYVLSLSLSIYIYINKYTHILPPLKETPLIIPPFGGFICYYQFRRRHDFPPHKNPPSEANIVTINLDGGTINLDGGNEVIL